MPSGLPDDPIIDHERRGHVLIEHYGFQASRTIDWAPATSSILAAPAAMEALLDRALAAEPASPALQLKRAHLELDRYDYAAAASSLEVAVRLDPSMARARTLLGHCYNALGRPGETLAILPGSTGPGAERARAFVLLERLDDAEAELRAILAADPHHREACRQLCKLLRRAGRIAEFLQVCEALAERGVRHSQLLYVWGTALVLAGAHDRAAAILLDRERIAELPLPVPEGFSDHAEFNRALAEELLGNPHRLDKFPIEDEANRGSSRIHALFAGRRPELVRALLATLQQLAESWSAPRYPGFDPWSDARPAAAQLRAWGLLQRGGEYEEWHLHPGGWMSGVYYVSVPNGASAEGAGPGCIEFGPPTAVQRARPGYRPIWRHRPREGHLLLAPSHYAHRTIPSGLDEYRISFAFDVVPRAQGEHAAGQGAAPVAAAL